MNNILIFGCGLVGRVLAYRNKERNVICFLDNDKNKWGKYVDGVLVRSPSDIKLIDYDKIYVANITHSQVIKDSLVSEYGVNPDHIECVLIENPKDMPDESLHYLKGFIRDFGTMASLNDIKGSVADIGVYAGRFSETIKQYFPDRKLHIIDSNQKLPDDFKEQFCFVFLDSDYYDSTKDLLIKLYPLISCGGVIVVYDYFTTLGAKTAVDEFLAENKCPAVSVGDFFTIAIIKN